MKTKKKSLKTLEAQVEKFNQAHKVGDSVLLQLDSGEQRQVKIYHEATILGGHTAVGWFEGVRGCYALESVIQ